MSDTRRHLVGLDGFRGVAALLVAVIHISQECKIPISENNFSMAVDFFFLLSGFVISLSYERKLLDGTIRIGEFIRLRLIRLYPVILLAAVFGIVWRIAEARFSLGSIALSGIAAIFVLPLPRMAQSANSYPINGPSWSLTHEIFINVLFAIFARLLRGRGLFVAFAVVAVLEVEIGLRLGRLNFSVAWGDQGYAIVRAAGPFLLGVILFRATRQWRPGASNTIPVLGGVVLALVLFAPINNVYFSIVCIFAVFPCLILAGTVQPKSAALTGILALLGEISYPLYAINQPLARWIAYIFSNRTFVGIAIYPHAELIVLVVLMSGIALAVSRFYDLPVRAALRHALSR